MLQISATFNFPAKVISATANNSERENLFSTLRASLDKLETDGSAFTLQLDNTSCLHTPTPEPIPDPVACSGRWFDGYTAPELRAIRDNDRQWADLTERQKNAIRWAPRQLEWSPVKGWKEVNLVNFKPGNIYSLCKNDVKSAINTLAAEGIGTSNISTVAIPEGWQRVTAGNSAAGDKYLRGDNVFDTIVIPDIPVSQYRVLIREIIPQQPVKAEVVIPEGWRKVTRGVSHAGDQELVADGGFEYVSKDSAGWKAGCYSLLIRKIKAKPVKRTILVEPLNTQSHVFLKDGIVLVPKKAARPGMCTGCYGHKNPGTMPCHHIPCKPDERADDREVVWVESKQRWNKPGYVLPK